MAKILLSLSEDLKEKLDVHCKKWNYERSEFIRELVRRKLFGSFDKQGKPFVDDFYGDSINSEKTKLVQKIKNTSLNNKLDELKKQMVETEKKYSVHNFGPNGNGVCFNCVPPHKAVV